MTFLAERGCDEPGVIGSSLTIWSTGVAGSRLTRFRGRAGVDGGTAVLPGRIGWGSSTLMALDGDAVRGFGRVAERVVRLSDVYVETLPGGVVGT